MFTFILSILAAFVVANLFTTLPILAAYYSGNNRDNKDRIFTILAILAINVYIIYTIIVNA